MGMIFQKNYNLPPMANYNENYFNNYLFPDNNNNFMSNALENFKSLSQNINLNPNFNLDNMGNLLPNDNFTQNLLYNMENSVFNNNEFPIKPNIINHNGNYLNTINNSTCFNGFMNSSCTVNGNNGSGLTGFANQNAGNMLGHNLFNQNSQNNQSNQSNQGYSQSQQDFSTFLKNNMSSNIISENLGNANNISNISDKEALLKQMRPRTIKNNKIVFCHSKKKKNSKKDPVVEDYNKTVNNSIFV